MTIDDCTTGNATGWHRSRDLAPTDHPIITGRTGRTLCGRSAYDQLAASQNLGRRVRIADLKPCERCARSEGTPQ